MSADDSRVDTAGDVAKLGERERDLVPRLTEATGRVGVVTQAFLEQAEIEREGDQPLLGAVVKVALQALPFALAGLDHAGARTSELDEARSELCVQPPVLESNRGSRAHRCEQLRLVVQGRVMDERRHMDAVSVDENRRSSLIRLWQLDCTALQIGPALELRQPVHERQGRIAQRASQRVAEDSR